MSGKRKLAFLGGACACLLALAGPALGQSRAERAVGDLLEEHPKVMALWTEGGEGTRALFGAPMTRGETPREAAEMFLFLYGEAFIDGDVELEESRVFPMKDGRRTVFAYQQAIEDIPVDGSIVRVMVSDDGESNPAVVYAAGHFARPPAGGLPEPVVTAGDALEAAMGHPAAEVLEEWAEPELVITTESGALSRGESLLAWKVVGWSDLSKTIASYAFWIDAQTGRLIRHADLVARHGANPTVSGTVTGGATPGTEPDKGEEHRCGENLPVTSPLPMLTVEITNATEQQVLDTATTDDTGYYEFFGANYPSDAKIRFTWDGPAWKMHEGDTCCLYPPVPPDARSLGTTFPVAHDQDFNPSPFAEFDTAKVNVHRSLLRAYWNGDGVIGVDDLLLFEAAFRKGC